MNVHVIVIHAMEHVSIPLDPTAASVLLVLFLTTMETFVWVSSLTQCIGIFKYLDNDTYHLQACLY